MPVRLLVILLLVVFEGAFIGFNLENTCNVWLFRVFPSVPVYLTVLVSFVAGVLLTVPFFAFRKKKTRGHDVGIASHSNVKYDLIGELAEGTGLTRKDVMEILRGIRPQVFSQFQNNPEEFIRKASALINGQKAAAVIRHIAYKPLDEWFGTEIFTSSLLKGRLGVNAMKTRKHLYDHLLYASRRERLGTVETN